MLLRVCRTPGISCKGRPQRLPHEREAKGAHLAAFVSCIPLFDSTTLSFRPGTGTSTEDFSMLTVIVWQP